MNRLNLKDIYGKNNDYNEIKACNLESDYVNPNDYLAIKNLSFELRRKFLFQFIITLIFNLLIGFLLYDFIKSNPNFLIKEFFLIIITFILFIILLFHIGNLLYSTRNASYKKTQYGVIKTKFFQKKTRNDRVIRHYYAHVIFPSSNTFIRKVNCSETVYNLISNGSKVLVVSFDNRTAHIVLI